MNRRHVSVFILILVCSVFTLGNWWPKPTASVLADDHFPQAGEDIAEVYRRVSPSVVSIEVEIGLLDDASGTGFVVDKQGHVVTNAHVVEDARLIYVVFQDGAKGAAVLVGMDARLDVAVLKVDSAAFSLKPVAFGDSDALVVGQSVLAIGNPFGLEATLTRGIISYLKRRIELDDGSVLDGMIQTDAAIAPGSSGGPLLSMYGEVIGVNSAGYGGRFGGTSFGFAIPSNTVKRIAETLIAKAIDSARARAARPVATPTRVFRPSPTRAIPTHAIMTPITTQFQPTVAVQPDLIQPTMALESQDSILSASSASVYEFNVGPGQLFVFENILLGDGVRLFLPNPVASDSWIRTDHTGLLRYRPIGASQESVISTSPFFAGFRVRSIDENKNRVVELDWSADGRQFSFRIAPPSGTDTANTGVWFWQPRYENLYDPTYPIIRDCPNEGYHSCSFVHASNARLWQTRAVAWSPFPGSNTLLLTVKLPEEGRNALAIAQAVREQAAHQASRAPHFVRYDYGHWYPNGQGIIVSGRRPDGRVIIGEVKSDLTGERIILDGSAPGLWLRDAVRRPNGQIVALGRPGAPGSGPVALYDQFGTQISGFIGHAPPEDVRWSARSQHGSRFSVQGRQYAVQVDRWQRNGCDRVAQQSQI